MGHSPLSGLHWSARAWVSASQDAPCKLLVRQCFCETWISPHHWLGCTSLEGLGRIFSWYQLQCGVWGCSLGGGIVLMRGPSNGNRKLLMFSFQNPNSTSIGQVRKFRLRLYVPPCPCPEVCPNLEVRPSVRPSIRSSVRPSLTRRVRFRAHPFLFFGEHTSLLSITYEFTNVSAAGFLIFPISLFRSKMHLLIHFLNLHLEEIISRSFSAACRCVHDRENRVEIGGYSESYNSKVLAATCEKHSDDHIFVQSRRSPFSSNLAPCHPASIICTELRSCTELSARLCYAQWTAGRTDRSKSCTNVALLSSIFGWFFEIT